MYFGEPAPGTSGALQCLSNLTTVCAVTGLDPSHPWYDSEASCYDPFGSEKFAGLAVTSNGSIVMAPWNAQCVGYLNPPDDFKCIEAVCDDSCDDSHIMDGYCDDGGEDSMYSLCDFGTDCTDCACAAQPWPVLCT